MVAWAPALSMDALAPRGACGDMGLSGHAEASRPRPAVPPTVAVSGEGRLEPCRHGPEGGCTHLRRSRADQPLARKRERGTGRRRRVSHATGRALSLPRRRARAGRGREHRWRVHLAEPVRTVARRARWRATLGQVEGDVPHPDVTAMDPHRAQAPPMLPLRPSWTWSPHDHPCALGRADGAAHRPPPPSASGGRTTAGPSRRRATAARPIPEHGRDPADGCDSRQPSACSERPYYHHPTAGKVPFDGNAPHPCVPVLVPAPAVPAAYE
jgi:hypothetical protein